MQILLVAGLFLALGSIGLLWWRLHRLSTRVISALGPNSGDSLSADLKRYWADLSELNKQQTKLFEDQSGLRAMVELASQKISIVRFNPFGDTGGDLSFVLAVLDHHNSGYVMTSIHGREGTRVYVKPIDLGKSKYNLSGEEKQALDQAARRIPQPV